MNKITVIGSINSDITLKMNYLPKHGETIHANELFTAGGGKGANQAIAAKRNGADTFFIGAVGNDDSGQRMLHQLREEGIDITGIDTIENQATGSAYILLDNSGENSIIIHSGANQYLTDIQVKQYQELIINSDCLIAQFESSIESTVTAFQLAKKQSVRTILNPAPAIQTIPKELLLCTDMIVPNETEVEILTGITINSMESLLQASTYLHNLGIEAVVITLGSQGAYYDLHGKNGIVPACKVKAIDTTAAGDTFIGAMATVLAPDFSNLEAALIYGSNAAALTVQRFGAQPAIPYKDELSGVLQDKE